MVDRAEEATRVPRQLWPHFVDLIAEHAAQVQAPRPREPAAAA